MIIPEATNYDEGTTTTQETLGSRDENLLADEENLGLRARIPFQALLNRTY